MKNKWTIPFISYGLAIISFLGSDFLWGLLKLSDGLKLPFSIGMPIVFLLIGHFISTIEIETSIDTKIDKLVKMPGNNVINILPNADEALNYLSQKLADARFVRNTRIPSGYSIQYASANAKKYVVATEKLLNKKDTVFRDIIIDAGKKYAQDLLMLSQTNSSSYIYRIIEPPHKGFINFIIITDKHDTTEVVFGWVVSEARGYAEKCFISQNNEIVSLFETVFEELWRQ